MWRNKKFLHNSQDFTILHIFHVEKSEILLHFSDFSPYAMCRNLKFLHMTDFSPHVSHVNFVTNMRYVKAVSQFVQCFTLDHWVVGGPAHSWPLCLRTCTIIWLTDLLLCHFVSVAQDIGHNMNVRRWHLYFCRKLNQQNITFLVFDVQILVENKISKKFQLAAVETKWVKLLLKSHLFQLEGRKQNLISSLGKSPWSKSS